MGGGLAFAAGMGDPESMGQAPTAPPSPLIAASGPVAVSTAATAAPPTNEPTASPATATPEPSATRPTAPPPSAGATSQQAVATPRHTATPASAPVQGDVPLFTDVAVLALAADYRLPRGRTFRECVADVPPPHGGVWPSPVHLYYAGKGKWVVETHEGEVGITFTEATRAFSLRGVDPSYPANC